MSFLLSNHFPKEVLGTEINELLTTLGVKKSGVVIGAAQNNRYHIASLVNQFFLYIAKDRIEARKACDILQAYTNQDIVFLPEKDDVLINNHASQISTLSERVSALTKIFLGSAKGAVITIEGLLQLYPSKEALGSVIVELKKNSNYSLDVILSKLTDGGYYRADIVESKGYFALRGDILDIFPIDQELPYRLEFFGDTLESIRVFAPDSMLSLKEVDKIIIPPTSDILASRNSISRTLNTLEAIKAKSKQSTAEIIDDVISRVNLNPKDPSLNFIIPFIRQDMTSIIDYLDNDAIIIFDEVKSIDDKLKLHINAHKIRVENYIEAGLLTVHHKKSLLTREELFSEFEKVNKLSFMTQISANPFFETDSIFNIKSIRVPNYYLSPISLPIDIRNYEFNGAKVVICAPSMIKAEGLQKMLLDNDCKVSIISDDSELNNCGSSVYITISDIAEGFIYPSQKAVLIGYRDIFRKAENKRNTLERKRQNFVLPCKGDYVVHEKHGVGISEGIVSVQTRNGKKDFYVILYKSEDRLYLPVDQLDCLEKYTGGDNPAIHRLGGKEFEVIKDKVKKSVKEMAYNLIALYEKRNQLKGHKYPPDSIWQKEMEDSFPYDETDDQLVAISEIKEDMEKGKVMDRLLCGDVGFGKTEVAIRAIFKTILEDKQAAFLAPTTILCQQHFNTLKARLRTFNIKIDILSRFMSADYIESALERIRTGETSIVVATHRLLSKDVTFFDLGLLVLDEEQRFGVEHKDKIKLLKNNVNVLSLSATPIPRTLHMSLTGIRDISTLENPPKDRLPIETYVIEYSDSLVVDAINKELARDGQVYILFNRVVGIQNFAEHIQSLVTNATVIYAHGQLKDDELEDRITAFYNKEAQILVSTTIIENGIDLPDANTLIVIEADRLGLSQLYQLRGRVGRSNNLAYAYFTIPEGKCVTEKAQKRLNALANFTELGSGFKIAMQDLEIRGAGNVLGREQHGDMEKVGYDLYCKLIKETMDEIKGIEVVKKKSIEIIIEGDTSLPQDYIADNEQRIKFYKRVSILSNATEKEDYTRELKDIFGSVPESVDNLMKVAVIKNIGQSLDVKKIVSAPEGMGVHFYSESVYKNELIFKAMENYKDKCLFSPSTPPLLIFSGKKLSFKQRLNLLFDFLNFCI